MLSRNSATTRVKLSGRGCVFISSEPTNNNNLNEMTNDVTVLHELNTEECQQFYYKSTTSICKHSDLQVNQASSSLHFLSHHIVHIVNPAAFPFEEGSIAA